MITEDGIMDPELTYDALEFLVQNPENIGHQVGFKDLVPLNGIWIREIVEGEGDYTLQAHRGSYKSSCLAVALAMFMVFHPDRNILFLRKTDADVAVMMAMVSKILKSNLFRDICNIAYGVDLQIVTESSEHISTNLWNSPSGAQQLRGQGLKSSITGYHAWLVVTDDICNLTDRISHAERERTKLQYNELQNIRNRGGRIVNLGTPWHKEDVFMLMPNIHQYDCYTTGLIDSEKLNQLRKSMTPSLFAANYELKHIADEDALFTTSPEFATDIQLLADGICHVDAAYGGRDYTAFTCARKRNDKIYMLGKLWHARVSQVEDAMINLADMVRCWPMYMEDNGDKGFLCAEIRRKDRYAKTYHESMNKFYKISNYLLIWWPNIVFLEGTDPEYIEQIMDYSIDAEHDDAPDSAASVCRILDAHRRIRPTKFGGL